MGSSNAFHPAGAARDYLAFDLEIARIIPDGVEDWTPYRPFGISCAATLGSNETPTVWHGITPDGRIAERMSRAEVIALVIHLEAQVETGKTILTWNGAGFDFSVLAEESGMWDACRRMALRHVDMMFHLFCLKGFGIGLDKAAKGMALRGKPAGMDGAQAPRRWQEGQYQQVLDYVCQDVATTIELCRAVEASRALQWMTSKGTSQRLPLSRGWLTVEEACMLPLPDTTWMRNPWPRSKFIGWMEDQA
ncbi:MAG TPA: ribonuclease H-like domain-containing protein [Anaerolineales bacterium]